VVAAIHNPYINRMVIEQRQGMGVKLIASKGISVRDILVELRNKNCVGLLIDQSGGRTGILVDFFGRKASTVKGPAQIAVKTGAPLLLCTTIPQGNGYHRMIFEEIPTDIDGLEGDAQILHITQHVTSKIEYYIRRKPEVWFGWLHRRWRIKPPKVKE
jgi:KDO2-lipid IV(A) lauroyltransferase